MGSSEPELASAPPTTTGREGEVIDGRYRLDRVLGRGAMGVVFEATQLNIGRKVALKELPPHRAGDERALARLEKEAKALASLSHPNIVSLLDVGRKSDGSIFIVMERLEGEPLSALIAREAPLPAERVRHIAEQILGALSAAHARGIIHRDIKPSNLFVSNYEGRVDYVSVLDFGIAKLTGDIDIQTLTASEDLVGSPAYLSPEQATQQPVTPASDLYSLALVLYEMLTGRPPFVATSALELLMAHASRQAPHPTVDGEELHGALVDCVVACLAKAPWQRPMDAGHALKMLAGEPLAQRGPPVPAVSRTAETHDLAQTYDASGLPPPRPKRRPVLVAALAGALVAGLVVFLLVGGGTPEPGAPPPAVDDTRGPRAEQSEPPPAPPEEAPPREEPSADDTPAEPKAAAGPPPRIGTRVVSQPEGATVSLDDEPLGRAPVEVSWPADQAPPSIALALDKHAPVEVRLSPKDVGGERVVTLEPVDLRPELDKPRPAPTKTTKRPVKTPPKKSGSPKTDYEYWRTD